MTGFWLLAIGQQLMAKSQRPKINSKIKKQKGNANGVKFFEKKKKKKKKKKTKQKKLTTNSSTQ